MSKYKLLNYIFFVFLFILGDYSFAKEKQTPQSCWKETFRDDFNGRNSIIKKSITSVNAENCFDRIPYCKVDGNLMVPCPEYSENLKDLNKCNWIPYKMANSWYPTWDYKNGSNPSYFDPAMIKVSGGVITFNMDFPHAVEDIHRERPYSSGTMDSLGALKVDKNAPPGFKQRYGKFEFSARFSSGSAGATGAVWLLTEVPMNTPNSIDLNGGKMQPWPDNLYGWPYGGEIDALEYWTHVLGIATQHYHYGDVNKKPDHQHLDYEKKVDYIMKTTIGNYVYSTFHTYKVEWNPEGITYYIDNQKTIVIPAKNLPRVPDNPMHWIIGLSYAPAHIYGIYNVVDYTPQKLEVDWVAAYSRCDGAK